MKILIQAVFDKKANLPSAEVEDYYREILEDADLESIAPQLYVLLKNCGRLARTPLFFQQTLHAGFRKTGMLNFFLKKETEQLLYAFEERGLDVIPIKGVLFAEQVFGHYGARPTSDIDLVIKRSALSEAVLAAQSLGFELEENQIHEHFHFSLSKPLPGSPIPLTVELHWDLLKEDTAALNMDKYWADASVVTPYKHVYGLSLYHTFYMITLHGWRHNLDSWKYYLDIMQLIAQLGADGINYEELLHEARSDKTYKRMVRTLSRTYSAFPFLHEVLEFSYQKHSELLRHEKKGIWAYLDFIDYQFLSYDRPIHSLKEFGRWLAPSKSAALVELGEEPGRGSLYFNLYKRRIGGLLRGMVQGIRTSRFRNKKRGCKFLR